MTTLASALISAGFPSPAEPDAADQLDLNQHLVTHPIATFFVRVFGNSMLGAGIHDGDLLIVDRALMPADNCVVVAILNGEFTVKRLKKTREQIILLPENKSAKPIPILPDDDFEIWGVATYVIHALSSQQCLQRSRLCPS